jgi:hypothetical protein
MSTAGWKLRCWSPDVTWQNRRPLCSSDKMSLPVVLGGANDGRGINIHAAIGIVYRGCHELSAFV